MNEYKIDKGIPIPTHRGLSAALRELEVGDSVVVDNNETARSICSRMSRDMGRKFTTRKEGEATRVWRVA